MSAPSCGAPVPEADRSRALMGRSGSGVSMAVARYSGSLRDALIFHRRLEHHAVGKLVDHGALDFLPRRLARRIVVAAILRERRLAPLELGRRQQNIGGAA